MTLSCLIMSTMMTIVMFMIKVVMVALFDWVVGVIYNVFPSSFLRCLAQYNEFFDALFYFHTTLYRKRLVCRPYDVPTAIDVLATGTYPRLPRFVSQS